MTLVRIIGNSQIFLITIIEKINTSNCISCRAVLGKLIGKLPISYQTIHVPKSRCGDTIVTEPKKSSLEFKKY